MLEAVGTSNRKVGITASAILFLSLASAHPVAYAQDASFASKRCVELGFKEKTAGYDDCVKQYAKSVGTQSNKPAAVPRPKSSAPTAKPPEQKPAPEMSARQEEEKFWDDAKALGNKEAFEAYLKSYPNGRYVGLAQAAIARMVVAQPAPVAVPAANPRASTSQVTNSAPGAAFKDCSDCPEMVAIPAGTFERGGAAREETPVHRVWLSSFSMGKTEVTQGQWLAIMDSNPSSFNSCGNNCPVENVIWDDSKQFISRLSAKTGKTYRLPSEAEWEYACRAGGRDEYCGGGGIELLGWHSGNSVRSTHLVAGKQANAWGLYDMSGNVSEWTEDCWNGSYYGAPTDGSAWILGDCSRRVSRGGAWVSIPRGLRSAERFWYPSAGRVGYNGFRVARTN